MTLANKKLGQHWLNDRAALESIVAAAQLQASDTVLEIGPGLGSLTRLLLKQQAQVIAVEIDKQLINKLERQLKADNLRLVEADILKFDLTSLPADYKVVANIPYYLTSQLLRILSTAANPPSRMVLLVQKEVAERVVAEPGQMNLLALSLQLYYRPKLSQVVPAVLFNPPPKVDSQVVILDRLESPLFTDINDAKFFRLLKAGFSEKRKKLRSSLAGGLAIDKQRVDEFLEAAAIDPNRRAQELSLQDWRRLYLSAQTIL